MQWKISDDGVCRNSSLWDTIQSNLLNILKPRLLDHGETVLPFVNVGDPAFPLKQNLMKPYLFQALSYKNRTFNHILTRAKRIEENGFGILPNLFWLFLLSIKLKPKIVEKITITSCVLHNYLREKIPLQHSSPGTFDYENIENRSIQEEKWRNNLEGLKSICINASNNYTTDEKKIWDDFCSYFNTDGSVPW